MKSMYFTMSLCWCPTGYNWSTEVLVHQVLFMIYVVKFAPGHRDFKVGSFKPVFHKESKKESVLATRPSILSYIQSFMASLAKNFEKITKGA